MSLFNIYPPQYSPYPSPAPPIVFPWLPHPLLPVFEAQPAHVLRLEQKLRERTCVFVPETQIALLFYQVFPRAMFSVPSIPSIRNVEKLLPVMRQKDFLYLFEHMTCLYRISLLLFLDYPFDQAVAQHLISQGAVANFRVDLFALIHLAVWKRKWSFVIFLLDHTPMQSHDKPLLRQILAYKKIPPNLECQLAFLLEDSPTEPLDPHMVEQLDTLCQRGEFFAHVLHQTRVFLETCYSKNPPNFCYLLLHHDTWHAFLYLFLSPPYDSVYLSDQSHISELLIPNEDINPLQQELVDVWMGLCPFTLRNALLASPRHPNSLIHRLFLFPQLWPRFYSQILFNIPSQTIDVLKEHPKFYASLIEGAWLSQNSSFFAHLVQDFPEILAPQKRCETLWIQAIHAHLRLRKPLCIPFIQTVFKHFDTHWFNQITHTINTLLISYQLFVPHLIKKYTRHLFLHNTLEFLDILRQENVFTYQKIHHLLPHTMNSCLALASVFYDCEESMEEKTCGLQYMEQQVEGIITLHEHYQRKNGLCPLVQEFFHKICFNALFDLALPLHYLTDYLTRESMRQKIAQIPQEQIEDLLDKSYVIQERVLKLPEFLDLVITQYDLSHELNALDDPSRSSLVQMLMENMGSKTLILSHTLFPEKLCLFFPYLKEPHQLLILLSSPPDFLHRLLTHAMPRHLFPYLLAMMSDQEFQEQLAFFIFGHRHDPLYFPHQLQLLESLTLSPQQTQDLFHTWVQKLPTYQNTGHYRNYLAHIEQRANTHFLQQQLTEQLHRHKELANVLPKVHKILAQQYQEAPEKDTLDPITCVPMEDPIRLPCGTYMDLSTITQCSDGQIFTSPFTRIQYDLKQIQNHRVFCEIPSREKE